MYELANYIPFQGDRLSVHHNVLAWSKKDGYYFTKNGFCVGAEIKIIAQEDV